MDSTRSYQARLAVAGKVVDRLLAEHPDGPTAHIAVDFGKYNPAGKVTLYVDSFEAVVQWAGLLGLKPRRPYGADCIQSHIDTVIDGVRIQVIGSTKCQRHAAAHNHKTCLEQAAAALVSPAPTGELVQA